MIKSITVIFLFAFGLSQFAPAKKVDSRPGMKSESALTVFKSQQEHIKTIVNTSLFLVFLIGSLWGLRKIQSSDEKSPSSFISYNISTIPKRKPSLQVKRLSQKRILQAEHRLVRDFDQLAERASQAQADSLPAQNEDTL